MSLILIFPLDEPNLCAVFCSYNNNTVNFYLIDPALVAFSTIGMASITEIKI
jgi:hypothetical protein